MSTATERPKPPATVLGTVPGTLVQTTWLRYLEQDRDWALAEVERLNAEVERLRCLTR